MILCSDQQNGAVMTWEAAFIRVLWCIFVISHLVMSYLIIEGVKPEILAGDNVYSTHAF